MKKIKKIILLSILIFILICIGAFSTTIVYLKQLAPTLPDHMVVSDWKPKETNKIYSYDNILMKEQTTQKHIFVPYNLIPEQVKNAFISAEDQNYWKHSGIDPVAILKAVYLNFQNKSQTIGGSTITQQVVKNLILSPERTLDRKIREAILAVRLDRDIGKEKILEVYLNQIYLGSGSYGVGAASKIYFNKDIKDLSIDEIALIAGLPKAPSDYNPFKNPEKALSRREYVLNRMYEEGFITKQEFLDFNSKPLILSNQNISNIDVKHPSFEYPTEEVSRIIKNNGLNVDGVVKTTIISSLQEKVHKILRNGLVEIDRKNYLWHGPLYKNISFPIDWNQDVLNKLPLGSEDWILGVISHISNDNITFETKNNGDIIVNSDKLNWITNRRSLSSIFKNGDVVLLGDIGSGYEIVQIPEVQGATVILNPKNGNILSMNGGFSFELSQYNRVTQAKRQTGSTFKSFVYLTALEMGYDATSPLLDEPIALEQGPGMDDWRPEDSHNDSLGLISLRKSLELSRNMSTVRLFYDIGMDKVTNLLTRIGFPLPEKTTNSMALGVINATPLDMAIAYSSIANGGYKVSPHLIFENGQQNNTDRVLDPIAVAQLTSILQGVTKEGTASSAFIGFDKPIASKTGTTNNSKDTWFIAYGPDFVVVTWIGKDDSTPLSKGSSGATMAAPIVRKILDSITDEFSFSDFVIPEGVEEKKYNEKTGEQDDNGTLTELIRKENNEEIK